MRLLRIAIVAAFSILLVACNHGGGGSSKSCAGNKFLMKFGCSLERVQREAEKGNADAQYALGYMYYYGIGTVQDRKTAMLWIRRSANQGQPLAKKALGMMASDGGGSSGGGSGGRRRGGGTSYKQPPANVAELNQPKHDGSVNQELPGYGKRKKAVLDTLRKKEQPPSVSKPNSEFNSPLSKHSRRYRHLAKHKPTKSIKKSTGKSLAKKAKPAPRLVGHSKKAVIAHHHESAQAPASHAEGVHYYGGDTQDRVNEASQDSLSAISQKANKASGSVKSQANKVTPKRSQPATSKPSHPPKAAPKPPKPSQPGSSKPSQSLKAAPVTKVTAHTTVQVSREALSQAERQLMHFAGNSYTLQIMGSHDLAAVRDFMRRHNLSRQQALLYSANYHNRPWYMLVYGNYASTTQARRAIHQMPKKLRQLHPWIKSMHLVHKEIRLRQIVS